MSQLATKEILKLSIVSKVKTQNKLFFITGSVLLRKKNGKMAYHK
jgi:hypothetical protein